MNLTNDRPNAHATFFHSHQSLEEKQGVDYHHVVHVNLSKLDGNTDLFTGSVNAGYNSPINFTHMSLMVCDHATRRYIPQWISV